MNSRLFTPADRQALLSALVTRAHTDDDVAAAALVGSGATSTEDAWSDIDLVLRVAEGTHPDDVAADWTAAMYGEHGAVHHLDVVAAGVLYRVFLLDSSLQVDVSFWPFDRFRGTQQGFRLLFGEANPPSVLPAPDPAHLAGLGWLHALHARSALARGRLWQAAMMLDGIRDQLVALACLRHGLPPHQGRGVDRLPDGDLTALAQARPSGVERGQLARALRAAVDLLLIETRRHDAELAARLGPALELLRSTAGHADDASAVER